MQIVAYARYCEDSINIFKNNLDKLKIRMKKEGLDTESMDGDSEEEDNSDLKKRKRVEKKVQSGKRNPKS